MFATRFNLIAITQIRTPPQFIDPLHFSNMASAPVVNGSSNLTAAQKLMQKAQEAHNPTIEDVPDEDDAPHGAPPASSSLLESTQDGPAPGWVPPMSAKAAGKQKAADAPVKENKPLLDTQSDELFPGLGGASKAPLPTNTTPIWGAKKPTGPTNGTNGSSTPNSGINTPSGASQQAPRGAPQSLAGQIQAPLLVLQKQDILPRNQLKKPLPEIIKDINKKLRTNLQTTTREGGVLEVRDSSNQKESLKQQAVRDLGAQIGAKKSVKVSIPRSARAHIIGKQGSTIKAMQESSGARIQMPKMEDTPGPIDEDDDMIDIVVEGNVMAIQLAKKEISKIASERTPVVNAKLRTIPAEFFPFITGERAARLETLEKQHGVQVQVPPHHIWKTQAPPQKPSAGQLPNFVPTPGDNHITIAGDRAAVLAARAEIEQFAQQLRQQLTLEQFMVNNSQHQFVIGKQGISPQDFFDKTGCGIILPSDSNEDNITVVGPADRIEAAMDYAMDLASTMNTSVLDISRQHRNAPGGARMHARNVTQYLRDRKEIERIASLHNIHIVTPMDAQGASPWQIFYRSENNKTATRAQNEIGNIINAHPPSRMATLGAGDVPSFYHSYLNKHAAPRVKKDYGVHMVIPNDSQTGAPILLVFEGDSGLNPEYQIPNQKPSPEEITAFERGLADARNHILDIINKQAQIKKTEIEVPRIFHEKLRKFIQKEQANREDDEVPIRVWPKNTLLTLEGPAPAVDKLSAKIHEFVAQAVEDEKGRGFTLSFDFPQKHANQLIGKGGSNIRELRDRFDVEINLNDGVLELKGPQAKAEAAKSHISSLGRTWADEATYTLKIDPKFHRELIGAGGATINKLQTKYKVQIQFPRSAKPVRDDQSNADAASEAGGRRGGRRDQEPDEVIVKGPKKGADAARDEILEYLQHLKDNSHVATVSVQVSQIPSLIGQRGAAMEEIRQLSGARIDIPNAKEISDPTTRVEIKIKGEKAQVAMAKKLIQEKSDVFDQTVTKTLEVDKKHHRALVGASGSAIRAIMINAGVTDDRRELARAVQLPKAESDGNLIKVEGKEDVVNKIIAAMEKIVADRESQTTETFDVPTDKHRSLIGAQGAIKKDLEAKFGVSIDIPKRESGQTAIKITGLPANVEKAQAHILELVKEQEGETIQIPLKFHHSIADNGQFFRRLRNDLQVTVDHGGIKAPPKPAAPVNPRANGGDLPLITDDAGADAHVFWITSIPDIDGEIPWILRGSPENVAKAKASLENAKAQALKNTATGSLILPDPHTYRYVIGQSGSKVNSIRKATGCKITVPRDQAANEAIEIVGSEENVKKTRDLILQAVKEGIANSSGSKGGMNGS